MGIGAAVALKCAAEGASVIIAARHEDDLKKTLLDLPRPNGSMHEHELLVLDVSDNKSVEKTAKEIEKRFGSINGLVNCAGIYGPIGKTGEINPEEFEKAIRTNFLGVFFMCRAFLPLLLESQKGKIVNLAGGGGTCSFPNYSAYAVSKVSVIRFTENMALEYSGQIDANSVAPGFVLTRLHNQTIEAGGKSHLPFLEKTKKEISEGGVPPEKAANLISFLLSEKSDGISGKTISAPWDPWEKPEFQTRLKTDPDFCVLRRIDDFKFSKKIDLSP